MNLRERTRTSLLFIRDHLTAFQILLLLVVMVCVFISTQDTNTATAILLVTVVIIACISSYIDCVPERETYDAESDIGSIELADIPEEA